MTESKLRVFISHAHADKPVALKIDSALRNKGVNTWVDKWEILPGDSLVEKIFEEGLKDCGLFLILLSEHSIKSKWVKSELDSAVVSRIEGTTRIVPVLVSDCDIPNALKPLLWIDLRQDFDSGLQRIADLALGNNIKPPVKESPVSEQIHVQGMTRYAAIVARELAQLMLDKGGYQMGSGMRGEDLSQLTKIPVEQLNDAVLELESAGQVKIQRFIGTYPYEFGMVMPTYRLMLDLRSSQVIDFDPEDDILQIVNAVVAKNKLTNKQLHDLVDVPATRLNNAVEYIEDYGVAQVIKEMGSMPYTFSHVWANGATRRFAAEHSK